MGVIEPTLTRERALLREWPLLIACDEVGRGALAGPVAVGATMVDAAASRKRVPAGLRDSKLVAEAKRPDVALRAAQWVCASAVGWASAAEVDEIGIIRALGVAALRAVTALHEEGVATHEALVILDGNHDYITPAGGGHLSVRPIVKADRDCASAAAASVIAKVARDALMTALHEDEPVYQWARNKGYASLDHRQAIQEHGLSRHHRASWAIQPATLF